MSRDLDERINSEEFHVKSRTDPEKEYSVYHSRNKGWRCECKGWSVHQKCWHIDYVIKEYGFDA